MSREKLLLVTKVLALLAIFTNSYSSELGSAQENHRRLRGMPRTTFHEPTPTHTALGKTSAGPGAHSRLDSLAHPINPANWSVPFTAQGLGSSSSHGTVRNIGAISDKVFVNGEFTGADDIPTRWVAIWGGSRWGGFGKFAPYSLKTASDMLVSGERVYFSGSIDSLDEFLYPVRSVRGNVAIWNGQSWGLIFIDKEKFASALGMWNGKLLIGIGDLGVWQWDAGKAEAFGPSLSGMIRSIEVLNSRLYIAGDFVVNGDTTVRNLAVWEDNTWKRPFPGKVGPVRDMAWLGNELFVLENHRNPLNEDDDSQAVVKWNGSMWANMALDAPAATLSALEADAKGLFLIATDRRQIHPDVQLGLQVSKWNGQKFQLVDRRAFSGWIYDVKSGQDGLIFGGRFQGVGDVRADNLIKWNGSDWQPFTSGLDAGPSSGISALGSDGKRLLFGSGGMNFVGKLPTGCAAVWDGTAWEALDGQLRKQWKRPALNQLEEYTGAEVQALVAWKGDLIVGGVFDSTDNREVKNIARWDGKGWSPLAKGYPGRVRTMMSDSNDLIVGGSKDGDVDTIGFSQSPFNGNTVARWNGSSWQTLNGLKGNVRKIIRFREDILALVEKESGFGDLAAWNGAIWRRALTKKFEFGIVDMVVHKSNLMLLSDSLFSWNGTSLTVVMSEMEVARGLASDGENLFVAGWINLPGFPNCILARWDGKEWHALASGGGDLFIPGNLMVHGDYLYMSSAFPEIGGKATAFGITRWNRKSGTWSLPISKRMPNVGPILRFDAKGMHMLDDRGPQSDIYGLDGKRKRNQRIPAGVSVIQRQKPVK